MPEPSNRASAAWCSAITNSVSSRILPPSVALFACCCWCFFRLAVTATDNFGPTTLDDDGDGAIGWR